MNRQAYKVIVVGGGLAGLTSAINLSKAGLSVLLLEKKNYPFHRVCGEYVSKEVSPFLKRIGIYPENLGVSNLKRFQLSDIKGNTAEVDLPLGGFGISRYRFDQFLAEKAEESGVDLRTNKEVVDIQFSEDGFEALIKNGECFQADFIINAYGKRAKLDHQFQRDFIQRKSPFIGVKYHVKYNFPPEIIGLYNFKGGYCGASYVEDDMVNLCYLSRKENLKQYGNIAEMEEAVLYQNPILKKIFTKADFVRTKPEVINEISFDQKASVENHMLMAGDTAGLITPLCGNGMAMAIHSGYLASEAIKQYYTSEFKDRLQVETYYRKNWNRNFANRLWVGRNTQNLFGNQYRSNLSVRLIKRLPALSRQLIKLTHGIPF